MKIAFFDYWTKGIHNFVPLNNRLISRGHETLLFHIGSFNVAHPKEVHVEGILCRDISYYDTKFIYLALKQIHPDIIISLNTTYILDRTMVLACRSLGIKTFFIMHGDRPIGNEIDVMIKSIPYSLMRKLKKAGKYASIIIPNYIISSWNYNKLNVIKLKPLKVLWLTFRNPGHANFFPPDSDEVIHDRCLIFANKYQEYYTKLGYCKENILVIGNPKNEYLFHLIEEKFPIKLIKEDKIKNLIANGERYALYLEDSFQEQGMAGWTYDYLANHLSAISDRLRQENIVLVVKLHPVTDLKKITLINKSIIFAESDLEHLIHYSDFCIGHISSTVNLAILLNKPVLIPLWGKSKNLPDYYVKHKVAHFWHCVDDDLNLCVDEIERMDYIKENITITQPITLDLVENEIYKCLH